MRKNKKRVLILGILLLVIGFGIGYAYLNTTLNISGTTNVDSNNWEIYLDNVQVKTGSVEAETPEIDNDLTTVSFNVHLEQPGDFYEFTVDAVNAGTIDAMIDSFHKKINGNTTIPDYINYTVVYADDFEIEKKHLLATSQTETYKVRVEYKKNINASDLPNTNQSLNVSFDVTYIQADNTAIRKYFEAYTTNLNPSKLYIGQGIPTNVTIYNNYNDVISAAGQPIYLKHELHNEIITASYVGLLYNGEEILLKGGNPSDWTKNKEYLISIFGTEKCGSAVTMIGTLYSCQDTSKGILMGMYDNGRVFSQTSARVCYVFEEESNYSYCRNN